MNLVLRRVSAQREVLAVAGLVLLTAVVLVTSCGVALRVASSAGVRAGLDRAAPADRVVVVSGNPEDADGLAAADAAVRHRLAASLSPAAPHVQRRTVSASYGARGRPESDRFVLGVYPGVRDHARLVEGEWPGDGQVAVPRAAARELGVRTGDALELLGQDDRPLRTSVSGVWVVEDAGDPFWAEDPLAPVGVRAEGGFRTFGPLLLPDDAPAGGVGTLVDPRVSWLATPALGATSAAELDAIRDRVDRLEADGADDLAPILPDPRVVTRLDDVLRALAPSLSAARTSVTVPTLLLLALAVASLVLAGRVVSDARTRDVALRESRGWSRTQVLRDAGTEMLGLGVLVGVVGPWLAPPLVRAVVAATGDSRPSTALEPGDWLWALVTALAGVLLLTWAAGGARAERVPTGWRRLLPRPRQVLEVLVVVLGLVAWQQSSAAGTPSLVRAAAPTLTILALLLVVARLVPPLARLAGGWVGRTRGLRPAVVGWELTRRVEQQRSSLVTTGLAAAVTVFLAGLVASWAASQDDQAAAVTAAPVRATELTATQAGRVVDAVGGVVVERRSAGLPTGTGTVLVLGRDRAADVLEAPVAGGWPRLLDRLAPRDDVVPALVSRPVAAQAGDGDRLTLRFADANVPVRVVGVLDAVPTANATEAALVVDRDALVGQLGGVAAPGVSTDDTEVWTRADPERVRQAAPTAVVLDRQEVADRLRTGPVGTGLVAGSVLALVAAVMLGGLAALSDTATALRTRRRELASLRAQGLSGRHLVTAVAIERAALLLTATLLGAATGWVAVRLFLGRLVLADSGVLPSPAARATAPWLLLATGTAAVLSLLVAAVVVASARVARRPLGTDLRETT